MGHGSAGNCLHPLALLRATTRCRQGLGAGDRAKPGKALAAVEPHRDRPRGTVPSSHTGCTGTRERCRTNPGKAAAVVPAAWQSHGAHQSWGQRAGCLSDGVGWQVLGVFFKLLSPNISVFPQGVPAAEPLVPRGAAFKGSHTADSARAAPNKGCGEPPTTAKRNLNSEAD